MDNSAGPEWEAGGTGVFKCDLLRTWLNEKHKRKRKWPLCVSFVTLKKNKVSEGQLFLSGVPVRAGD